MGENSKIGWTDHTFNPWIGCTAVSPACHNCYAERQDKHRGWTAEGWGKDKPRKLTSEANWKQPQAWNRKAAKDGTRPKVFCASLADVFDDEVDDAWRARLFALIAMTPHLDWLVLTKRAEKMNAWMTGTNNLGLSVNDFVRAAGSEKRWTGANLWLGVTVENQTTANERIPLLLDTPAAKRFVSMEPLLGAVDLNTDLGGTLWIGGQRGHGGRHRHSGGAGMDYDHPFNPNHLHHHHDNRCSSGLDWVIAGGESGPKARPSHPDWFRSLRAQCAASRVPFMFKQWGELRPAKSVSEAGRYPVLVPGPNSKGNPMSGCLHLPHQVEAYLDGNKLSTSQCAMAKLGIKHTGRMLDGVHHDGVPE